MNKIKIYPGFENEPEIISKSLQSRDVLRGTDLYANLGVGKSAGKKDIINKYRELSKSGAHPDKGGKAKEWNKIADAYAILMSSERGTYDNFFNQAWWTRGENEIDSDGKYSNEVEILLADRRLRRYGDSSTFSSYLPDDLKDWESQLKLTPRKTIREIKSYASKLLTVSLSVSEIRAKLRDEEVENSFSFPSLVVRFKGLQAKSEIERVAKNIITEIENRADNLSHVSTKFKSKRAGVREIQNLNGWNELSEDQRTRFVERVKNAFKDEDNNKTLKTVIKEIVNEVREEIKEVRKNKPDQGKIKQLKQEYSRSLEAIQGWNKLLELNEQDYLKAKIDIVNSDKKESFQRILDYASKFLQAAYYRKYYSKFWEELEKTTELEKEEIRDGDDMRKGKKIGERYKQSKTFMSGVEPIPLGIDATEFVKFKLFFHALSKTGWNINMLHLKIYSKYGEPKDSGWKPSKGTPKPKPKKPVLFTPYAKEAIATISSQIRKTKGETEEKVLGANWKKRFENVSNDAEIDKIWEDFIDRIGSYRKGTPNPWIEGNQPPPPTNLQAIIDAAKQEILREAFDKEPVIDGPELEPSNQDWENDIDNSSKKEEINFIKERVLADIRNKRANKDKATKIISLLAQAKQEKNWNDYEKLATILKQIKEVGVSSNAYKEQEQQIEEIEGRLKQLNPDKFRETTKDNLTDQKNNAGLTDKDISAETQKAIDEAVATGDLDKKKQAEELLAKDEAKKNLDDAINSVKKALNGKKLTKKDKEELLRKLLEIITQNDYQKHAYQDRKSEVDALLAELKGDKKTETQSPFWKKALVPLLIISLLGIIITGVLIYRRKRVRKINSSG